MGGAESRLPATRTANAPAIASAAAGGPRSGARTSRVRSVASPVAIEAAAARAVTRSQARPRSKGGGEGGGEGAEAEGSEEGDQAAAGEVERGHREGGECDRKRPEPVPRRGPGIPDGPAPAAGRARAPPRRGSGRRRRVDMMAASAAAPTRPARRTGAPGSARTASAASSGWASGPRRAVRREREHRRAESDPDRRLRLCAAPMTAGRKRSEFGLFSIRNLWSMCGWPRVPRENSSSRPNPSAGGQRAERHSGAPLLRGRKRRASLRGLPDRDRIHRPDEGASAAPAITIPCSTSVFTEAVMPPAREYATTIPAPRASAAERPMPGEEGTVRARARAANWTPR